VPGKEEYGSVFVDDAGPSHPRQLEQVVVRRQSQLQVWRPDSQIE